jgi:hypothetical protein
MLRCYQDIVNTRVASRETIFVSRKRRKSMYYRVAIQADASPTWQWKSTTLSSLNALFQLLRRYRNLSQDHLRVFSSSSREDMDEQFARENNGLASHSVTAAQFMQEQMIGSQQESSFAAAARPSLSGSGSGTGAPDERQSSSPASRRVVLERGVGGDFWNLMALAGA